MTTRRNEHQHATMDGAFPFLRLALSVMVVSSVRGATELWCVHRLVGL